MTQLWTFLELRIDSRVEDIGWKLHLEVRWRYQKQDRDEETDGEEEGNGRVDNPPDGASKCRLNGPDTVQVVLIGRWVTRRQNPAHWLIFNRSSTLGWVKKEINKGAILQWQLTTLQHIRYILKKQTKQKGTNKHSWVQMSETTS